MIYGEIVGKITTDYGEIIKAVDTSTYVAYQINVILYPQRWTVN